MKTYIVQQTNHELRHDISEKILFELQEIGWNLSMMRLNYKLTKRTKTEKYKKCLRTNKIVNFNTVEIEYIEQHHPLNPQLEAYETSQHFTTK